MSLAEDLSNPIFSLPLYGHVIDQKTQQKIAYDPLHLTYELQITMLDYIANPPRNDYDQTYWMTVLGPRQSGKSLTPEFGFYCKAAYTPYWDHVCTADKRSRAEYLHKRVRVLHDNWDEEVRAPTRATSEVRQLTFANGTEGRLGSIMRVETAGADAAGIGQSVDSFHGSEIPFWPDAAGALSLILPSMINRDNALVIQESTPAPSKFASAAYWRDQCKDGQLGIGRWLYFFFPFWDSKVNSRRWKPDWIPDTEELRLYETYGPQGMTWDNLAFRRVMLDTDDEFRKDPTLFGVYYPFDDVTCWTRSGRNVIPEVALRRFSIKDLVKWEPIAGYQEYQPPRAGAIYVIGADPTGYAARDHAAFQVLEVWEDEWVQVATFAMHCSPEVFTESLATAGRRFNNALIVCEENGVGAGTLALLKAKYKYKNLYYRAKDTPGWLSSGQSNDQVLAQMIEALRSKLKLYDLDTFDQLTNYGHDKRVERPVAAEILQGEGAGSKRRARHHWDKVSALGFAVAGARLLPVVSRPEAKQAKIIPFNQMTYNQLEEYKKQFQRELQVKRKTVLYRRK
jgi:hypothetical protein